MLKCSEETGLAQILTQDSPKRNPYMLLDIIRVDKVIPEDKLLSYILWINYQTDILYIINESWGKHIRK